MQNLAIWLGVPKRFEIIKFYIFCFFLIITLSSGLVFFLRHIWRYVICVSAWIYGKSRFYGPVWIISTNKDSLKRVRKAIFDLISLVFGLIFMRISILRFVFGESLRRVVFWFLGFQLLLSFIIR